MRFPFIYLLLLKDSNDLHFGTNSSNCFKRYNLQDALPRLSKEAILSMHGEFLEQRVYSY